jgi:hypothetical protein
MIQARPSAHTTPPRVPRPPAGVRLSARRSKVSEADTPKDCRGLRTPSTGRLHHRSPDVIGGAHNFVSIVRPNFLK